MQSVIDRTSLGQKNILEKKKTIQISKAFIHLKVFQRMFALENYFFYQPKGKEVDKTFFFNSCVGKMYKYRLTQKDKWLNLLCFSLFLTHCHCYKLILTFFWLASSSVLFLRHYFLFAPFLWCILHSLVYRNHCSFIHLLVHLSKMKIKV